MGLPLLCRPCHVTTQPPPAQPPPVRRRGKAPPVEPFTGENPSELLEDWQPTLERAGHWNGWSGDEMLLQLAGHLRGRALQEWNLIRPDELD